LRCKGTFECWLGYRPAAGRIGKTTRGAGMTELDRGFSRRPGSQTDPVFRLTGFYHWRYGSSSILLLSRSLFLKPLRIGKREIDPSLQLAAGYRLIWRPQCTRLSATNRTVAPRFSWIKAAILCHIPLCS
jgi:hypothetical protein